MKNVSKTCCIRVNGDSELQIKLSPTDLSGLRKLQFSRKDTHQVGTDFDLILTEDGLSRLVKALESLKD